jgi:head-tail adaptor
MTAGAMRDRLRFEKRVEVDDGAGNTVGDWAGQFVRSAEIRPLITPAWRAVDTRDGTIYAIQTAADMERRREWIAMMCVAGGAQ